MWIAFRIVFLLMIPNKVHLEVKLHFVVNCFQNCIFTYDSQQKTNKAVLSLRCELLSELYFYLWFPTFAENTPSDELLWIAFRIVFLLMIPNLQKCLMTVETVVNCFQNCIFTYDSQLQAFVNNESKSCELLSELYFYLWFPTKILCNL